MTTKKYKSNKLRKEMTQFDTVNPSGSKIKKLARKHNLDGSKQSSLITQTFNMIKRDKREIALKNNT